MRMLESSSFSLSFSQQDFKDRIHRQKLTQSKIKENRQQIVRARKYYDDYRVQLRAKMMRMRTREEMVSMAFLANAVKKVSFVLPFRTTFFVYNSCPNLNLKFKYKS